MSELSNDLLKDLINENRETIKAIGDMHKDLGVLNTNIMGPNGLQEQMKQHKAETKEMFAAQDKRLSDIEKRISWKFKAWLAGIGTASSGISVFVTKNFPWIIKLAAAIGLIHQSS